MTALASRIGRIERWRNEIEGNGKGGRLVVISAALAGLNDHDAGCIDLWKDGGGAYMVVPSEHSADPCQGLSDRQRNWLRIGDHIDVDSLENGWEFGDGAVFNYTFDWPCDPGPPGHLRAV